MKKGWNKRGSEYYYIIISFIIGLLILGVAMQLIFDFGGKDDIDFEACKNSIIVRSNAPEYNSEWTGTTPISFKNSYPLKCQTNVITIEKEDIKDINKTIADALVSCWALFDNGDSNPFPSGYFKYSSYCVPCVRIHLTNEAKEELKNLDKKVFIRDILDDRMKPEYSYYSYLRDSGNQFSAFDLAGSREFNFNQENFLIDDSDIIDSIQVNKLNGKTVNTQVSQVYLPREFDPSLGDLIISNGFVLDNGGYYTPYLFYFQQGQKEPSPLTEVNEKELFNWDSSLRYINFCENWEGVPA